MLKNHGPFRREGVDKYISQMSKVREKPIYDSTVTELLQKAGFDIPEEPASIYRPEQLWMQLERYSNIGPFNEDEFISKAIKVAFSAFGKKDDHEFLEPLQSETQFIKAIKLEKHAGVYFQKKADAWPRAWTRSSDVVSGLKRPNPCLAGARTQRGNKTRLVWMYPLEMTILEATFAFPLIQKFKDIRTPIPYAKKKYEVGARLDFSLRARNKVALDFSKFDSSIHQDLIKIAFRILRTWFIKNSEMDVVWQKIINYFIFTPIVMVDGNLYTGKSGGVPSGSFFTQLVDSICNFIIIYAAMLKFRMHPDVSAIHILGDDSVFSTNADVNLSELQRYFEKLGFTLNVQKSEVKRRDESIHFIGFEWLKGIPYRDVSKVISSLSQPEKWRTKNRIREKEFSRAYRLIVEMSTLGANLYEISQKVTTFRPYELNYFVPEGRSVSGYVQYQREYHPVNIEHDISVGLWI